MAGLVSFWEREGARYLRKVTVQGLSLWAGASCGSHTLGTGLKALVPLFPLGVVKDRVWGVVIFLLCAMAHASLDWTEEPSGLEN